MTFQEWELCLPFVSHFHTSPAEYLAFFPPPPQQICGGVVLEAEGALIAVLHTSLQLRGRLSDVYPALTAPGLAAGMAASALNLNGLGVMNRLVLAAALVEMPTLILLVFKACLI